MANEIPFELTTICDVARKHIEKHEYDKAIETYKYVLIMYKDQTAAVEHASAYLGDVYLSLKRPVLAETYIRKALSYSPEKPSYRYQLGFAYTLQQKWKKAIRELEFAHQKDPRNSEYLRGLGWAVFNGGDIKGGLGYLHQAHDISPDNVYVLADLSVAYLSLLDFRKAKRYIKRA
jgi:tetratricopeptide (TPR) repeat protein